MTGIYLIRHGETRLSEERRFYGSTDPELAPSGIANTRRLALWLKAQVVPSVIYVSPLRRAQETAQILHESLWSTAALESEPALRETYFGEWEGLSGDELTSRYPEQFALWRSNPVRFEPPGGESVAQLATRVGAFYEQLQARHPVETVALVCHGGPIRALLLLALDLPLTHFWHFNPPWASVSYLEVSGEFNQLRYFGQRG